MIHPTTRVSEAMSEIPRRCGFCSALDHLSPECPEVSPEEVLSSEHHDQANLATGDYVRCAVCGVPTRVRAAAAWTVDTHETICNECFRAEDK
jgi:hypothetical protein